nr:hypothetical protein [Candidatus Sigynarchaeum springense]
MIQASTTRDPLALHYAFAKRQPFVVAGFLDSTEFAGLKDFVPHLTVHESLDKLGAGKADGAAILAQLLDSEQEDLVEGQKNVIAIHNVSPEDLDLLATTFKQAWLASTVLPAADVARKYKVPVYDTKAGEWANVHPNGLEALWARSLLAVHGDDAMGLRMALKGIYFDACQLAAAILAGDVATKASAILDKYGDASTRDALIEATTSYFGINARELLQGVAPAPPKDAIAHPVMVPVETPKPKKPARISKKEAQKAKDTHESEYFFLSKNAAFKRALVKVVGDTMAAGIGFTSPAAKYSFLRREGAWQGGLPAAVLRSILEDIVGGCKDKAGALEGAKTFQLTATAFKLATQDDLGTAIATVLAHANLPDKRAAKIPLVAGRSWPGMDPPPADINALISWIGQGIAKLRGFSRTARQIAWQRGLAGAGHERYLPVALPKAIEQMRGAELVPWLREVIANLQGWVRQLGAAPMHPAPSSTPRALAISEAAWKEAGEKLATGDLEGYIQKAYLSVEKGISGLHEAIIGKPPAENATLHDQVIALAIKQPRLLLPSTDALHAQRKLRNKVVNDNSKVPPGWKERSIAFYKDFHERMAQNLDAMARAGH